MKYCVLPIGHFDQDYTYESDTKLSIGDVVKIPIKQRNTLGIVTALESSFSGATKNICEVLPYQIPIAYVQFIAWVSRYTLSLRGQVLKMVLCEPAVFKAKKEIITQKQTFDFIEILLNNEQKEVFNLVKSTNNTMLLHGVTGAGKTEVYLKLIQQLIQADKQVLILLPEIALTPQMVDRITKYLGTKPFVWNSGITPKNRKIIWATVCRGETCIVLGTRSALFLPFKNLGLIVVDEEHDPSYKQNDGILYNARDMAVVLGQILKIPVILSSATPSLETYLNAKTGRYNYFLLQTRFNNVSMPKVEIIDFKKDKSLDLISTRLYTEISTALQNKEQILLYLNRRGYSPIVICRSCGEKVLCPDCSAFLVLHKDKLQLKCHICGYTQNLSKQCKHCGNNEFITFGAGVEKLHEEVLSKFPDYVAVIASSDTMNTQHNIDDILSRIQKNEINIIIATQILAKGHHFKNLSTIGIVDGDFGLDRADIRAIEKNYQLLYQVLGRAGREVNNGRVFIQTFEPNNPVIHNLKTYNQTQFLEDEITIREQYNNPPFSRLVAIIISGPNESDVIVAADKFAKIYLKNSIILGPVQAPLSKIRNKFRWRLLIKSSKKNNIQQELITALKEIKIPRSVQVQIDVDPINFL